MHHGEKLQAYLDDQRINKSDFAEKLGVKRATLYQMFGRKKFTKELIDQLNEMGVNFLYSQNVESEVLNENLNEYSPENSTIGSLKYVIETQKHFIEQQKDLINGQRDFIKSILPQVKVSMSIS